MIISRRGAAASHLPAASSVFGGRTRRLNSHQYGNMVLTDKKKNVRTHAQPETFTHPVAGWKQRSPLEGEMSCCFFFFPCSKFTVYFFSPFLWRPPALASPAFQLVADVVSARNIRSLSWFPHFNYNATWRTDLLDSEGWLGNDMRHAGPRVHPSRETS